MLGFIVLAVYVYKKTIYTCPKQDNKNFLKVENALRLSASKTIYVLKAGNEKFLIDLLSLLLKVNIINVLHSFILLQL